MFTFTDSDLIAALRKLAPFEKYPALVDESDGVILYLAVDLTRIESDNDVQVYYDTQSDEIAGQVMFGYAGSPQEILDPLAEAETADDFARSMIKQLVLTGLLADVEIGLTVKEQKAAVNAYSVRHPE